MALDRWKLPARQPGRLLVALVGPLALLGASCGTGGEASEVASDESELGGGSSSESSPTTSAAEDEQADIRGERAEDLAIEVELPEGWEPAMERSLPSSDDQAEPPLYVWAFSGPEVEPGDPGVPPPLRPGMQGVIYVSVSQPAEDVATRWHDSVALTTSLGYEPVDETLVAGNRAALAMEEHDDHASRTLTIEYQDRILTITSSYLDFDELLDVAETVELQPGATEG